MPRLPAGGGTSGNHLCRGALRAGLQRTAWARGAAPHPAPRLALFFQKTAAIFRGENRNVPYFAISRIRNGLPNIEFWYGNKKP